MSRRGRPRGNPRNLSRRRIRAVGRLRSGVCAREVARSFHVSERTIRRWHVAFGKGGPDVLETKRSPGRPCRLTDRQRQSLLEELRRGPVHCGSRWTCHNIAELIQMRFGVRYHLGHISRLIASVAGPPVLSPPQPLPWQDVIPFARVRLDSAPESTRGPYGAGVPRGDRFSDFYRLHYIVTHDSGWYFANSAVLPVAVAVTRLGIGHSPKQVAKETGTTVHEVMKWYRQFLRTGHLRPRGWDWRHLLSPSARTDIVCGRLSGKTISTIAHGKYLRFLASKEHVRQFLSALELSERTPYCSISRIERWRDLFSEDLDVLRGALQDGLRLEKVRLARD